MLLVVMILLNKVRNGILRASRLVLRDNLWHLFLMMVLKG